MRVIASDRTTAVSAYHLITDSHGTVRVLRDD